MVKVRVVTGSFRNPSVQIDEDWPVVPRVGEQIDNGEQWGWTVKAVRYEVGADGKLIGVMLLGESLETGEREPLPGFLG